jgi:hypothetical protein
MLTKDGLMTISIRLQPFMQIPMHISAKSAIEFGLDRPRIGAKRRGSVGM